MPSNQLPTRDELFVDKGWDRAPSYSRVARGLHPDQCIYNENLDNDWFEVIGTDQMGYVKNLSATEAFCEQLASRLASCAGFMAPQVDVAPFRSGPAIYDSLQTVDEENYACFSPLLGSSPRTLQDFIRDEDIIMDQRHAGLVGGVERSISSLIPFWMWTANKDVHGCNIILSSSSKGEVDANLYGIDNAYLHFKSHMIIEEAAHFGSSLSAMFRPWMPFQMDASSMTKTAERIVAIPHTKIREIVEQAFDVCQISPKGLPELHHPLPSAVKIRNLLIRRSERLESDIQNPAYMAKVFGLTRDSYDQLNKRIEPERPRPAFITGGTRHEY